MSRAAKVQQQNEELVRQPPVGAGRKWLLGLLLGAALLYIATLPWQRRMAAETARIEKENAAKLAEATRLSTLQSSLEEARQAVERNPGDARAQLHLAQRYGEAGQLEEAEQRAQIAVGLLPQEVEPLLFLADLQQRARHYDAAIRAYRAAIQLQPEETRALAGLAYLYISFGWPLEAEALLKPAIAAAPQNPQLKVTLALAYVQHEDYKQAESLLLEAQRLAPEEAALWSPLAQVYNEMKRYPDAITAARKVMSKLPYYAPIVVELGKAYFHLNDLDRAETAFHQALAIQNDNLDAHYYLGLIHQRSEEDSQAVTELEEVLKRNPDFGQTRQILGKLYLRTHRTDAGQKLIQEAGEAQARGQKHQRAGLLVASKPRDAGAHWQMALVYHEEKNDGRALVELRKTLELKPDHSDAQQLLAQLQAAGTR